MHIDVFGDTAPSRSIISYDVSRSSGGELSTELTSPLIVQLAFSKDFNFMAGDSSPWFPITCSRVWPSSLLLAGGKLPGGELSLGVSATSSTDGLMLCSVWRRPRR